MARAIYMVLYAREKSIVDVIDFLFLFFISYSYVKRSKVMDF